MKAEDADYLGSEAIARLVGKDQTRVLRSVWTGCEASETTLLRFARVGQTMNAISLLALDVFVTKCTCSMGSHELDI